MELEFISAEPKNSTFLEPINNHIVTNTHHKIYKATRLFRTGVRIIQMLGVSRLSVASRMPHNSQEMQKDGSMIDDATPSRPPVHALVALYHCFDFLLRDFLMYGSVGSQYGGYGLDCSNKPEPNYTLESASVDAQICILQQLFLHERTQWRSIVLNASSLLQIRPIV
jgi:hypothetical protein